MRVVIARNVGNLLSKTAQSCWNLESLKALSFGSVSMTSRQLSSRSENHQNTEVSPNIKINYEKVGNGSQAVLCLPGALGFIESDFSPQLSMLKNEYTLVAWDPPGYGKSRPPVRNFSGGADFFRRDAQYAHQLMKNLGIPKFSILGWSDGGITGLILASSYPDSVEKLVVWGANAFVNDNDVKIYKKIRDINTWSDKMKAPMIKMYGEEYFRKMWEEWVDTFDEIYKKGGDLCKSDLKLIQCPTLIIHGLKDPMVGLDHAEYLKEHIPQSELYVMPEGRHNLHLRYPEEFNSLVRKFLSTQN